MLWQTSRRTISLDRPLVMGILNVTPDSFSDGGSFLTVDDALRHAERIIEEGGRVIDIGGESTRPRGTQVPADDETARVVPVIEKIAARFDVPVSVDTTKLRVARAAIDAGAEIVNDISGLRWCPELADLAAETGAGLVAMHSRGSFDTMHAQPPVDDIFDEVTRGLRAAVETARVRGVADQQIVLDVGIGFGKTKRRNLELIAGLDKLRAGFPEFGFLVGASRKSFIGKLLDNAGPAERLSGSLAVASIAVWNGADIIRAHDVKATVEALAVVEAVKDEL